MRPGLIRLTIHIAVTESKDQKLRPRRLSGRAWAETVFAAGLWLSAGLATRPWFEIQKMGVDIPSLPCAGLALAALALVASCFALTSWRTVWVARFRD